MVRIRLLGRGLKRCRRRAYGIGYSKPPHLLGGMVGYVLIVLLWRLKGGGMIGYDGFKHRKSSKMHVCVDEHSIPLSISLGPRNEHDSRRIDNLLKGLEKPPRELYADSAYDTEHIRGKLSSMNIKANIPINSRNGRKPKPYNIEIYKKMRSAVKRF